MMTKTINNLLRKTTLVIKKTTDVGGDVDQSHTAKKIELLAFSLS
jgi:hypothetical protein